ncbi:MAG: ABC transporter substrate-binding protein [Acidimicrobiales bacterium]
MKKVTTPRRRRAAAAVSLLGALAAAACGSSTDDAEQADSKAATTTAKAAGGAAAGGDASTWGVVDKKLTGPSGFTIDLSTCPAKWSDTAGITDAEIRLGQSFVMSGTAAAYGAMAIGAKSYFDYVNTTEGGIGGKKLVQVLKDDGYEAARTKTNMDELLETANVFGIYTTSGTPTALAVYDKLNESCVLDLIEASGHNAFGDPANHPWTTSGALSYATEANIWGKYILDTLGKGTTVAALVINNDFGILYRNTFEKFAKENGLSLVKAELYEPSAATVTNELTTLASSNADVFISMTNNTGCTPSFRFSAETTWKPKLKIASNTCSGPAVFKPAGQGGNGWIVPSFKKDAADPTYRDDPGVKTIREQMQKTGLDPENSLHSDGYFYTYMVVEALKKAATFKGGLTRTNAIIAARSLDIAHPLAVNGIKVRNDGLKDAFLVEGAQLFEYVIQPGQEVGVKKPIGPPIDFDGTTPNCAWDGKTCK